MEVWSDAILKAGGRDWSGIKGGKRARSSSGDGPAIYALTESKVFNRKAITRVTTAAGRNIALKEGDPIKLDKKRFTNYTATLRAFARALADGVTNLPDGKKGS